MDVFREHADLSDAENSFSKIVFILKPIKTFID
jgi:hypothetical protein